MSGPLARAREFLKQAPVPQQFFLGLQKRQRRIAVFIELLGEAALAARAVEPYGQAGGTFESARGAES